MAENWITVFGGTGFLGRRIVECLAGAGVPVRIAARNPESTAAIAPPAGARIERIATDVRDRDAVARALAGATGAVNTVGLYVERGGATFKSVHVSGAGTIAEQAAAAGLTRLVHVSGIGVEPDSDSAYVRSRAEGEKAVTAAFPGATMLQPSVLFAPDDIFINVLLRLSRILPIIPLFGDGGTLLQPVFAGDVAAAAARALEDPAAPGMVYELGGPRPYHYRELVELVMAHAGRRRKLIRVPFALWEIQARLAALLPNPPLTRDQIALMREDNLPSLNRPGLADLGIDPTPLEEVLPLYPDIAGR